MTAETHDTGRLVLSSLRVALKPLARLCLRHSVKLMDLFELLKVVLVEAAEDELKARGDKVSMSRISVISGVHRRDVDRIQRKQEGLKPSENLVTRVLGQWQNGKRFTTARGEPRVLTVEGTQSEFFELVRSVSADVAPYTVLYEMERLGLIERTPHGVRPTTPHYLAPRGDVKEGITMLAEDLADMSRAVEFNIFSKENPRNLHLKTEYTNVSPDRLPAVRRWLLEEGSAFHRKVSSYLSQHDRDIAGPKGKRAGVRVALGSFSVFEGN